MKPQTINKLVTALIGLVTLVSFIFDFYILS
ncbi:signal peptidase [Vibrio phage BUCT194]|uniref:Signal peptidase n=1 Tax=Vibrio phage BUCT194 TaxID=2859072 RepID=A0AAE8XF68_9CAUD|nr:signal peptidase [Vibrio phage BUCT194]UAW01202.1 signal peptidase [Vibrio phage BUCT194]